MRCVSDNECRRPMCLSLVMRMRKAIATGIAMTTKVQEIHEVLWTVKKRVSGMRYMGMGTAIEIMAISDTVSGKPRDCGHLVPS